MSSTPIQFQTPSVRCTACNAVLRENDLIQRRDGLEIYQCSQCRTIVSLTVSYALNDAVAADDATFDVVVTIDRSTGTGAAAQALRRLFPAAANLPIAELKRSLDVTAEWAVGRLTSLQVEDLQRRLNGSPLSLSLKKV